MNEVHDRPSRLTLVYPSVRYEAEFRDMMAEWEQTGEKIEPFVLRMDDEDFAAYVSALERMKTEPTGHRKTVNSSTFWSIDGEGRMIGAVNIRHELNEHLLKIGGHISFGIRPGARRRGYAVEQLRLALSEAGSLGLSRVLVTCDEDHEGARRTILRCGGVLENETFFNGKRVQRYWIDLQP